MSAKEIKNPKILDEFKVWMVERGAKGKLGGVPSVPMSPSTARTMLGNIRRMLIDLGYMNPDGTVDENKKFRDLSVVEVEEWSKTMYNPALHSKSWQANLSKSIRKFAEFLHFEKTFRGKPVWSDAKLRKVRERLYIPQPSKKELEIIEHKKVDEFIAWLELEEPLWFMLVYSMRWLGMRYSEARNAPRDLWGKNRLGNYTLRIDRAQQIAWIWGKGRGGLSKRRWLPVRSEIIEKLDAYIKWRDAQLGDAAREYDNLFCYTEGRLKGVPLNEMSPKTNHILKGLGKRWGKFTDKEMGMLKTHSIGRHTFGTYYAPVLETKTCMEYMGIEKFEVFQRYQNYSKAEKITQFEKAHRSLTNGQGEPPRIEGTEQPPQPQVSNGDLAGILRELKEELAEQRKEIKALREENRRLKEGSA